MYFAYFNDMKILILADYYPALPLGWRINYCILSVCLSFHLSDAYTNSRKSNIDRKIVCTHT